MGTDPIRLTDYTNEQLRVGVFTWPFEQAAAAMEEVKRRADEAKGIYEHCRDHMTGRMRRDSKEVIKYGDDETCIMALVAPKKRVYNGPLLAKILHDNQDLLDRITTRQVIPAEFTIAVKLGEISQGIVDQVSHIDEAKPYLKFNKWQFTDHETQE